jgi:hypothetical protein
MAQSDKLKAAFKECKGPFPWKDFVTMLGQMGYEALRSGHTAGAGRKFRHPATGHKIICHEPHNGEMGRKHVKAMQDSLDGQGLL